MAMDKRLTPVLLELVRNLMAMCQGARIRRPECKLLADLIKGLIPLLQEIQGPKFPPSPSTVETLRSLMHALIRAQKVVKQMQEFTKIQLLFRDNNLAAALSSATSEIQACLSSLPLVQLKVSADMREEIKQLKTKLGELGKRLKESESTRKDQQDLAAEITDLLRAHNTAEASSSGGSVKVMDKLMQWLADRFDSDVDTVRKEWKVMKEEAMSLRDQIEYTSENKRQIEEELLQFIVYIDSNEHRCASCASRESENCTSTTTAVEASKGYVPEFHCRICLQLLVDPVITGAGSTYCRKCITSWFRDNNTCPNTGTRLTTKNLIDNIALKGLIARWTNTSRIVDVIEDSAAIDAASPILPHLPSDPNLFHPRTPNEVINTDEEIPPGNIFLPPSPSFMSPLPVKSVTTYISLLSSNRSVQVLKSLKELTSIASFTKGQVQVFEAGGIPAISELLKEADSSIAEKAAGVLEALTFEIKGRGGETTANLEERDQICSAVTDIALEDLIHLMQYGNKGARLKAAQAVINLLADEEIRAEVVLQKGVVSAFYLLTNVAEGFIFENEGKLLCIKGLNLLSGGKASGPSEDDALTVALLRLLELGASSQVADEALQALRLLVETEGEDICQTLVGNKAIPFLLRSVSRPPGGQRREDALKILNEMSLIEGMPEAIVKYELFSHLFPVLHEANDEGDCLNGATKLLSSCLSSVKGDISLFMSQAEVKSFVSLLALEQTSAAAKLDILSSLQYLCREGLALRVAFLKSAGVVTLQTLVTTTQIGPLKDGVAQIIRILAAFQSCHKDILRQGGMELLILLLTNDDLECCSQAVVAAEMLLTGPEGYTIPLAGFPFESVMELLGSMHALEFREAAVGVLNVCASRNANSIWDRKVIDLLLDLVRPVPHLPITVRKKAADALLVMVRQDSSCCLHIVEADGLRILMDFAMTPTTDYSSMVIQLLSIFCKGNDNCKQAVLEVGGLKFLLEALEKGRMKEESAIALRNLVNTIPARKAVLQANFIECATKCILLNGGFQCSIDLTRALTTVTDSKANALRIREANGVKALVDVIEGGNEAGRKVAATALTKLIKLDQESSVLLGQMDGIRSLCNLLMHQGSEASEPFHEVEALEALSVASEERNNKIVLVEEWGIPFLLSILTRGESREKELALNILLNLSREGPSTGDGDICTLLINERVCKHLFEIVRSQTPLTEKGVYIAICIIRNLSLSGSTSRTAMLEEDEGVVKVLLDKIRFYDGDASSEIVRVAVMSLEKFMLQSRGRMALIKEGGIKVIVQVLQHKLGTGQAKSFATKILVMITQDAHASKEVCLAIFNANVLPGLRDILELGPDGECKRQACILLQVLMYSGPRAAVCKCVREEQCIPKLLDLKALDIVCRQAASDTLDLLKTYDRESKKQIVEADNQQSLSRPLSHKSY